jgi:4-hydroxybenzoate polyprenyltransferase
VNFQDLVKISRWFEPFPEPPGPQSLILVAFFILWTVASIYLYRFRRRIFARNGALIGVATRFGGWAITIGVIGLLLLAVRYAGIPYLDMRFLLYLTVLAAVAFLGFVAFYLRQRYPAQLAAVRAHEVRRRYAPDRKKRRRR